MRLLLASLLLIGCATLQPGEGVAIGALGADVSTTLAGTSSGTTEANPLYGSGDGAVVASLAVGAVLHYLIREHLKNKPPEVQKRVWKYVSMIRFGVAGWNTVQIAK